MADVQIFRGSQEKRGIFDWNEIGMGVKMMSIFTKCVVMKEALVISLIMTMMKVQRDIVQSW